MDCRIFNVIAVTLAVTLHLQINTEAAIGSGCSESDHSNCTSLTEICDQNTKSCIAKSLHNEPCTSRDDCATFTNSSLNLICHPGSGQDSVCLCPEGYYYKGALPCSPNFDLKPTITGNTTTYNSIIIEWTTPGAPSDYSSKYTLDYSPGSTVDISDTSPTQQIQGLNPNTPYQVTINLVISIRGREQSISSDTVTVTTKSSHNEPCTSRDDCATFTNSSLNLICHPGSGQDSVCLCPEGYYYNGALPCSPNFDLKPTITGNTMTYNSIIIEWTTPGAPSDYSSKYTLDYSPGSTVDISDTSPTQQIQGLNPNTPYQVTINLVISIRGREQSISSDTVTVTTKSSHNEPCTSPDDCATFTNSSLNLICHSKSGQDSVCLCPEGYYYSGALPCSPNLNIKPTITGNTTTYNSIIIEWTTPGAPSDYSSKYTLDYSPGSTVDISDTSPTHQIQGLNPNTPYQLTINLVISIRGREQSISSDTVTVTTKSSHNEPCTSPDDCATFTNSSLNLICHPGSGQDSVCLCPEGYYYSGALPCSPNFNIKPTITGNTTTYNSIIIEWTTPGAPSDYSSKYTLDYSPGSTVDISDTSPTQQIQGLNPNTPYQVTINLVISIRGREQSISSDTVTVTTSRSGYKEPCSNDTSCDHRLPCYNSFVCLCPNGTFNAGSLPCLPINIVIPSFSLNSNLTSVTVTLGPKQDAGSLYTSTYTAQQGNVNRDLTSGSASFDELMEGTVYNITVTRTLTLIGLGRVQTTDPSSPQNISTKVSYNNTCGSRGVCIDDNADCYERKCLCNPNYYMRNETCRPIGELVPKTLQAFTLDISRVAVNWLAPLHSIFVSAYRINATPTDPKDNDTTVEVPRGGDSTITLTGLQPGTQYSFSVESKSTNDGRVEYVTGNSVYNVTRPAKIEKLDETHSNFSAPNMKVAFSPAVQKFLSFMVTLRGDGYDQQINATDHTDGYYYAVFSGITPGHYYNIEVVTISVQNSQSEPFTARRRAMVDPASKVVGLRNVSLTSRSVIINWERPEVPNGDLLEYSLEILSEDDVCLSRIIFNCTEYHRYESQFQDTAPSCQNHATINITRGHIDDESFVVEYNVTTLDPDTNYNIQAVAYNEEGRGKGRILQIHTLSEPARKPKAVRISSQASNSVIVTWIPEIPRPGNTRYVVRIHERNIDNEGFTWIKNVTVWGYDSNTLEVSNLSSYWEYQFNVQSQSEVPPASEFVTTGVIRTLESAPTQVVDLEASEVPGSFNKVRLSWKCPPQKNGRNGIIRRATVRYETESLHESVIPKSGVKVYESTESCSWDVQIDVTAGFNYTFIVFISNSFEGAQRVINRYAPEGPPPLKDGDTPFIQIISGGVSESNVAVDICTVCLFNNQNGAVVRTGLLVCMLGHCPITGPTTKKASYYDSLPNWDKAKGVAFTSMYRATDNEWLDGVQQSQSHRFILGGEDCSDVADQTRFCNGPLPKDTYRMWLFACTSVSCTEGSHLEFALEDKDKALSGTTVGAIVASILAVIIVAIIIAIYIKVIRPRSQRQRGTRYVPDTSPKDDTYEEIDGGNRLNVIRDGRPDVDYYNTRDSPPRSENTYDQLKVYNNEGCHDYGQIKVTRN